MKPGDHLGPYEIVACIGVGGMGEVYRAHDSRLGRDVAIKVLPSGFAADAERLRRFEQEARAASALDHPSILVVHDVGAHEGAPYLVTELLEGASLRDRLAEGPWPSEKAADLAAQIASGLAAAHGKDIVHRDIKPENLFVTRGGHAKILDFGLAKRSPLAGSDGRTDSPTHDAAGDTAAGFLMGTVGYMSPEQARGEPADARSDIFSFGCVLYELLGGRPAFKKDTAVETLHAILKEDPPQLTASGKGVSPALARIVRRCLAKRPADRFASASELHRELQAFLRSPSLAPAVKEPSEWSIVVLPFENLSPDPENAFFADGLTEELIADLSKVRALRVISRTSAMLLKGSKKDVPTIGRELGVRYVLEGSVRRSGNSLRITAQLIDAADDVHLWAEKYGGTLNDVFAIQEQVSRSIVDALKLTLTADEKHRLAARMIPDVRAFDLYLQARYEAYHRMTEEALEHAVALTRQALDLTGPNPRLYSLLAEIEWICHDQGIHRDEESLRQGEAWARRALELEPHTAAAFLALGAIEARRGDMVRAVRDLTRAAELEASGEALALLAWRASEVGQMAEAKRRAAEAVAVDPLYWICRWSQAWVALLDGEFETALRSWRDVVATGDDEPIKPFFLAVFAVYAGRVDEACELFGRFGRCGLGAISGMSAVLGSLFTHDPRAANELLSDQNVRNYATQDKEMSWWLAAGFSFAGVADEALHWLGNAIALGFVNHHLFSRVDPFLAALRGNPRFEELMDRVREKQRAFEGAG